MVSKSITIIGLINLNIVYETQTNALVHVILVVYGQLIKYRGGIVLYP